MIASSYNTFESLRTILRIYWTLYNLALIQLLFSSSYLSNAMDKNVWSCTFTVSDLMAWCWIKHRNDFMLSKSRTEMREMRNVLKILAAKPLGKRTLAGLRHWLRYVSDKEITFEDIDWIHLAQDWLYRVYSYEHTHEPLLSVKGILFLRVN